jgi:hypothetical protein
MALFKMFSTPQATEDQLIGFLKVVKEPVFAVHGSSFPWNRVSEIAQRVGMTAERIRPNTQRNQLEKHAVSKHQADFVALFRVLGSKDIEEIERDFLERENVKLKFDINELQL